MSDQNSGRDTTGGDPLTSLGNKIRALDSEQARAEAEAANAPAPMGRALQLGVDMAAGVGVGAFIGYVLDTVFVTSPWLMIAFLFVGFAAGVKNVIRRAQDFGVDAEAKNLDTGDEIKD